MGWWKIQGTASVIGDEPLDVLGEAVAGVVAKYQTAFGRRPTRDEWESLICTALGVEDPERRLFAEDGHAKSVKIELLPNDADRRFYDSLGPEQSDVLTCKDHVGARLVFTAGVTEHKEHSLSLP